MASLDWQQGKPATPREAWYQGRGWMTDAPVLPLPAGSHSGKPCLGDLWEKKWLWAGVSALQPFSFMAAEDPVAWAVWA